MGKEKHAESEPVVSVVFVVKQFDGEAQAQLALRVGHSLLSALVTDVVGGWDFASRCFTLT